MPSGRTTKEPDTSGSRHTKILTTSPAPIKYLYELTSVVFDSTIVALGNVCELHAAKNFAHNKINITFRKLLTLLSMVVTLSIMAVLQQFFIIM